MRSAEGSRSTGAGSRRSTERLEDPGAASAAGPPEQALAAKVAAGDKEGLEDLLTILLSRRPAASVINDVLVPAMRHVGELFGRGEMLLPFVLQSAETMKMPEPIIDPTTTMVES